MNLLTQNSDTTLHELESKEVVVQKPISTGVNPGGGSRVESQLVFVYGSLKHGYKLHYLLESQLSLGNAVTQPLYRLFDLGLYPGLIEWPEGLTIHGEIYHVDANCLALLDEVEGVAERLYVRRRISLQTTFDGREIHAWFWLGSVSGLRDCGTAWP